MKNRILTALPVFNEESHIEGVLKEVAQYADDILVVDDGSSDQTVSRLNEIKKSSSSLFSTRHEVNRGYGAALKTAFEWAIQNEYDILVTIDCDGQHQPSLIPEIAKALQYGRGQEKMYDMVSGSRYLKQFEGDSQPPEERRAINWEITQLLNKRLGLNLTDTFCGFKSYRVEALKKLNLTENGYAMPLQLWVQAVQCNFQIIEFPIPLVYLEEERSFGGSLDDSERRKKHYLEVIEKAFLNSSPEE